MRAAAALLLAPLVGVSCASAWRGPGPEISATHARDGVRVRFRRLTGADPDRPPELSADGGTITEVTCSPDLKAISALWCAPEGRLSCRFPYDGVAVFDAGTPPDPATVRYVFLEAPDVDVTAALPRGCLLLPALPLRVRVDEDLLPVRVMLPDGRSLSVEDGEVLLPLTTDERGVLHRGDLPVTLETARGPIEFLVGIDGDGTPAAVTGYVTASGEDIGTPGDR